MIGTIRKHTGWLWAVIITATIISFIYWGAGPSRMNGGGGGSANNFGTVYGKKVTSDEFFNAKKDFLLNYYFRSGTWPDNTTFPAAQLEQEIYGNLMVSKKAEKLGIHVSEDEVAIGASQRLQSMSRDGTAVPLDALVTRVLTPNGFTAADFESYIRHELVIQQLIQTLGLPGVLITPQEATAAYQHDHEELSSQVVFFSLTNYIAQVKVTPEILSQFYTNYQAAYRLPDQVQVNYVVFDATNYLAQSKAEWAKTNFTDIVEGNFQKVGETYKGSKSPAEARAKITDELVDARALADAKKDAYDFANQVFAAEPTNGAATPAVLTAVASQLKLSVHQTSPFSKDTGPLEIENATHFTKAAFELTPDVPISEPVVEGDLVYVLALAKSVPSHVPAYEEIRFRVSNDYQQREASVMAQRAGASFYHLLTNQLASGHSFAAACVGLGRQPEPLPPISIGTEQLPELGEHASLGQIKQVAFTTPVGKSSPFEPTADGGFILFVQSKQPVDASKLAADLPQFTLGLRRQRENEAFGQWYQTEANSALVLPPKQ
jgi:hypothetical protein